MHLDFETISRRGAPRGGRRPGAGRPPTREEPRTFRAARRHNGRCPVHVTLRVSKHVPYLRRERVHAAVVAALWEARVGVFHGARRPRRAAQGTHAASPRVRVIHYSLQSNHLHMIVEAALSRGMQGLVIRLARAINRVTGRHGPVFPDRFHSGDLDSPTKMRRALVYVLQNAYKHAQKRWKTSIPRTIEDLDRFSSARFFDGWRSGRRLSTESEVCGRNGLPPPSRALGSAEAAGVARTQEESR